LRSKNATAPLDHIFYALSDPTRREILATLAQSETGVTQLAQKSGLSLPAISKHLRVLERGKLIRRKSHPRDGRAFVLGLEPKPMKKAVDWLEKHRQYWNGQFDALEKFLEAQPQEEKNHEPK
jgi:DNA-binding transcriptional ArsR family regulator